ncbi:hypothetical protein FE257_006611 [Aspergillus nanangensis]|uniref:Uncharacterized protein n=1 Tax=Aspergillus nanangensis TaxID=2582783 RepID=A0AAD4CXU4_ASPNN|nr:hypothetical protein FE257_006611 [Aspergillus nanangensis]
MSVGGNPSVDLTRSELDSRSHGASTEIESQKTGPANDGHQPPLRVVKRRKHLPLAQDQSSKNQIFYFVDSNSSSREKRAHVMRHHVQEKRRQRKPSHPRTDNDKKTIRPLRYLPWQQKKLGLDGGDDVDGDEFLESDKMTVQTGSDDKMAQSELPMLKLGTDSSDDQLLPSPVNCLDASRKDPFNALPMTYSREDLELADYFAHKLTYWSGQNLHIKNQIFQTAMNHPLTFQAVVLTYSARWKAQLYNIEGSQEVETHLGQSKNSIKDVMNGSIEIDMDSLAMTLTGMALHEERFGSKQNAREYADQAVQILRPRAGSRSAVAVFLHYVLYIMSPPEPTPSEAGQPWLITFLRGAEDLMLEHNTGTYLSSVPQRRSAFQMDSPLFSLLSSGPRPSQVPHDSRMYVVRNAPTQELSRTAALIYITTTLWDYQDSPGKTGRFLNHLRAMVKEHKLDRNPACETFIWLLLQEDYEADLRDPERGWSTGELLKTHKQLRPDLQFLFNEILFSLLMLAPPIRGIDAFETELYSSKQEELEDV